jgi:histone H1/5
MTDVAASAVVADVKAKTPKKKMAMNKGATKKPADHPKYSEMVHQALGSLKERGGSSRQAILKYLVKNFKLGTDEATVNTHLKMALRAGVKNASLKQSKGSGASGSFRLGEEAKKKPKAAKKAKAAKKVKKPKAAGTKSPKKMAKKTASAKPKAAKKAKADKPKKAVAAPKKAASAAKPANKAVAAKKAKPAKVAKPKKSPAKKAKSAAPKPKKPAAAAKKA